MFFSKCDALVWQTNATGASHSAVLQRRPKSTFISVIHRTSSENMAQRARFGFPTPSARIDLHGNPAPMRSLLAVAVALVFPLTGASAQSSASAPAPSYTRPLVELNTSYFPFHDIGAITPESWAARKKD